MVDLAASDEHHVREAAAGMLHRDPTRVGCVRSFDAEALEVFGDGLSLPGHPDYPDMAQTMRYEPELGTRVYRITIAGSGDPVLGHVVWCSACMGGHVLHFVNLAGEATYLR